MWKKNVFFKKVLTFLFSYCIIHIVLRRTAQVTK